MSAHTPGPWKAVRLACQEDRHKYTHEVVADSDDQISWLTTEANARLIAAAPELLETLESLVALFEMDAEAQAPGTDAYTEIILAKELCRKARGE